MAISRPSSWISRCPRRRNRPPAPRQPQAAIRRRDNASIHPPCRRQCWFERGIYSPPATSRCPPRLQQDRMYAAISRIYSAARRRLEAFITALPGSHDGCGGSRRGSHRHRQRRRWSSPFRTPLGSPMSMSSIIGAADEQATPASSGAAYATPQGETATPSVILASPLPPPQMVVVALDATRDHRDDEIKTAFRNLVERGDILRARDSLLVLGVLHSITHPSEDHLWNITTCPYFTTQHIQIYSYISSHHGFLK